MKEIDEQLTQAKELWDDGKQVQAIQILEELDEKTPTTQVAELLNHFYVANQQYSEALQLVANQSTNFLHHPGVFADYLGALIATNNFIVAWKTLASADQQMKIPAMVTRLEEAEVRYQEDFPQSVRADERYFYHLGDRQLADQIKAIKQAYHLPQKNYIRAASFNLVDPYLNQLTRVSILKDLVDLRVERELDFIWLDEKSYRVVPAQIDTSRLRKELMRLIEQSADPVQAELLIQQAGLMYDLAFPFPERVFATAAGWLAALQAQFLAGKEVKQFHDLNKIMNSIMAS